MSQTAIVVEDGVIQCEHGGKVVLTSSEAVHVIGGKKPLHDIDLMGAPIQGCPYHAPAGGNCTSVASITSAVTEENVSAGGLKYLLRTDGCKTDKGAALVLVDPGQTNSTVPSKSEGGTGSITQKELEDAKVDTKENIKKEKYRIHPLRKSNGKLRALRGARDFKVHKNFYVTNDYTHEKVITKTDAYLYVTHDDKTMEYKVINRGDSSNPVIQKVQFKDEEGAIRKHIPFYKDEGTMEIIYSNIRLNEDDRKHFTPSIITIGSKKNAYVQHHKNYSKTVKHEEKAIKKIFISQSEAKKLNKTYLNIVIPLDDPIGEVEDLYEEMETSFYTAYAHNLPFIKKVKERNAYAYSVANFVDNLYLDGKEREENKALHQKLQDAYYTLVQGVKEDFLAYITQTCHSRGFTWNIQDKRSQLVRLNGFIEYDVALSYIEEVKYCASSLLIPIDKYLVFRDYKNDFEGDRTTHLNEHCCIDPKTDDYYCLGNSVINHETGKKYDLNRNYSKYRDNSIDMMALTVFSLFFSGKHDDAVNAKNAKYKEAAASFHYTLKNMQNHPEFNEDTQDDINDKLKGHEYKNLFKNGKAEAKDSFIADYEDLDVTSKFCAFSWKKKRTEHLKKFKTLIPGNESFEFYYQKAKSSPIELSDQLYTKLKDAKLKDLLAKYIQITEKDKSLETTDLLLNMAYSISASRTKFDLEATQTSAFNTGSAFGEFVEKLSLKLQGLEASTHEALYEKDIFKLYHNNLHALITHALIQGEFNAPGFASRKDNANKLLAKVAPDVDKKYQEDIKDLNDGSLADDLKIKIEHEQLFEKLKALDGITSKIHGAEDNLQALDDDMGVDDGKGVRTWEQKVRKSKPYKTSIAGLKGLSFFITLFTTGEALKTFKKGDLKALLDVSTGINQISKTLATTAIKPLSQTGTARQMVNVLFADEALPQKAISKLAVPAIVVGSFYEIQALDDEDYDAMIAVTAKAAIFIAIAVLASGTWVAIGIGLAIGAIVETLWYFYSKYLIDSRVEILIEQSLYYQGTKRTPYILESLSTGNTTYIFNDKEDTPIKEITNLGGLKATRDFIYNNYADRAQEFQTALSHEFNSIHAALQGVQVKKYVEDLREQRYMQKDGHMLRMGDLVALNKDFYKEMKQAYLVINAQTMSAKKIDFQKHKVDGKDYIINLLGYLYNIHSQHWKEMSESTFHLLLSSDHISVKYKLDVVYSSTSKYFEKNSLIPQWTRELHVADLHTEPLLEDDLLLLS